jgi:thiamine transport system substrate-binding protein
MPYRLSVATLVALVALAVAACGGSDDEAPREVVLVTHDSFALSKPVQRAFERESGFTLRILKTGDAGAALNRALLTAGNPEGDVFFGADNNLLSRALGEEELFEPYESPQLEHVDERFLLDDEHRLTPVDHGEVCLNTDRAHFEREGVPPPQRLADLTEERYRDLLVVENPATSTPGLAFLLATVAEFGDRWPDFWRDLRENGVLVVDGWEEAYTQRFSGAAGGAGGRPIVVSYASSPAAEVVFAGTELARAPTAVVAASCFRQVELAGVLRGARNEEGARALIDFMLSPAFQRDVPLSMFVFPVREDVALPPVFAEHALEVEQPLELPPGEIGANRDRWIREWTDVVLR